MCRKLKTQLSKNSGSEPPVGYWTGGSDLGLWLVKASFAMLSVVPIRYRSLSWYSLRHSSKI